MRRNDLVNQVGVVHNVVAVSPSNAQYILCQTSSKKGTEYSKKIAVVLCNNYRSCNLIGSHHFWGISPRNSLDRFSPGGMHRLGMRLATSNESWGYESLGTKCLLLAIG